MAKINGNIQIGNTGYSLNRLVPYVLYNNSDGASTDITLNDNYTNYKYLDIYCKDTYVGSYFSIRVDLSVSMYFMVSANVSRSGYNGFMAIAKQFYLTNYNKLYKNIYADFVGIYCGRYSNTYEFFDNTNYDILIVKVVGYK